MKNNLFKDGAKVRTFQTNTIANNLINVNYFINI